MLHSTSLLVTYFILIFSVVVSFLKKLFMTVLDLCCYVWAFSSFSEQGLLCIAMCGLLIAVTSQVAEHRL